MCIRDRDCGLITVASAFGEYQTRAQVCGGCPCEIGSLYNRTIHKIFVTSDITTATNTYNFVEGYVYGLKPDGTTGFYNVLDTRATNSTGPVRDTVGNPGTYQYHFVASINTTPCNLTPDITETVTITVYVSPNDDGENNGEQSCNMVAGEPVNITNGNMYVRQMDYRLPGAGEDIEITRTYNSNSKRTGLFGYGWATRYDESINAYGTTALRLNLADGRAVFFARPNESAPFAPKEPPDFRGQITRNADTTYTLTLKDDAVHQFGANGKLTSIIDRNGNATNLTYDANGKLMTISDPSGRTLALAYTTSGVVNAVSDQTGAVATYTYNSLKMPVTVTYADNSQFKFTYGYNGGAYRLTTVKDALNNILEEFVSNVVEINLAHPCFSFVSSHAANTV